MRCFIASPLTWPPSELPAVLVMCTLSSSPLPSHSRHYRKRGIGQIGRDHSGDETVPLGWMDGRCIDKACRFYTTRLEFTITLPRFMYLISFVFHSVFPSLFFFLGPCIEPHHSVASLLYVFPLNFPADEDGVLFDVSDVWPLDGRVRLSTRQLS